MKKLYILIGPDTLGVKYKSKTAARRALKRLVDSKRLKGPQKDANLVYRFKGRPYCAAEIKSAEILTEQEHFRAYVV
jgi:hypothetical protein